MKPQQPLLGLILHGATALEQARDVPAESPQTFPYMSPSRWQQDCRPHHLTAFETVSGPVTFGPQVENEHPTMAKMSGVNATAWEQLVFDSVSDDAQAGVFLSLARDSSYAFFGRGNLHAEVFILLADGTKITENFFMENSTFFDCGDHYGTASTWASSNGHRLDFRVEPDLSAAYIFMRTSRLTGKFVMKATVSGGVGMDGTVGHFAGSGEAQKHELAPGLNFFDAIPGARVIGRMAIDGKADSPYTYEGSGGHLHHWAADNWFKIVWGFRLIRGSAGPYSFFYWAPVSKWAGGRTFYAAHLFRDGELVVATKTGIDKQAYNDDGLALELRRLQQSRQDYAAMVQTHHGRGVRGSVAGKGTGHILEFSSPARNRTWRFELVHEHVQAEMPFGGGLGLVVYINRVFGGEVGGCHFLGSAFSEDADLGESLAKWKIVLLYGVGLAAQLWESVLDTAARLLGGSKGPVWLDAGEL